MLTAHNRFYILVSFFLLLLDGRNAWQGTDKDKMLLLDLCNILVNDLARKATPMWNLKDDWAIYKTYAIAEKIYLIRAQLGRMVRVYLKSVQQFHNWDLTQMIRNVTTLQRMGQQVFIFLEELVTYDDEIMGKNKLRKQSRIAIGENCQVAGTMFVPETLLDKYRRKIIDGRRDRLAKTYLKVKPIKPAEHVSKEISESLKPTTYRRPKSQFTDTDYVDLAPDFV